MSKVTNEFKINRLEQFIMAAGYQLPSMGVCDEVDFVHPVEEIRNLKGQVSTLRDALIELRNMTYHDLTEELYLFSGFGKKYTYADLVNKIHEALEEEE